MLENVRKVFEANFPLAIQCGCNLAFAYGRNGKLNEAEELNELTLEIASNCLAADDSVVLCIKCNLASTICRLGRWDEAVKLREALLEVKKTTLQQENQHTVQYGVWASLYQRIAISEDRIRRQNYTRRHYI